MARYTGPRTKKARAFGEAIYGPDKSFERRKSPPGQHGATRRRKQRSDYAVQLTEKQKVKYIYGVLEKQFSNLFDKAARKHGVTGENLLRFLEARLDNVVYRLGISPTRRGARQLVLHKHITVNGHVVNIASFSVKPGDVVAVREKSKSLSAITESLAGHSSRAYNWLEWNQSELSGTFLSYPERDSIPETIHESLIVELYSK
jgi:small subunit ribosomal protein S4